MGKNYFWTIKLFGPIFFIWTQTFLDPIFFWPKSILKRHLCITNSFWSEFLCQNFFGANKFSTISLFKIIFLTQTFFYKRGRSISSWLGFLFFLLIHRSFRIFSRHAHKNQDVNNFRFLIIIQQISRPPIYQKSDFYTGLMS